ncbi:copper resistance system multicopper oxidase [Marinihelvus fidelis]|uniref:Copper resistance system multicopper oxidase n=1 Tax=Marinihelvus fidelis TaxID=2613842 RepID=A0A5N0TCA5_9GAMM|nr:copper resistance system multicopper oxidase [Marinihelvus fidelis]KAA9130969.1 copper resistance system multicopper oxidase [Marinihelvus fidelis]
MTRNALPVTRHASPVTRRQFVLGTAAAGALVSAGTPRRGLTAGFPGLKPTTELSGQRFGLRIGESTVNFTGQARRAVTTNGSLPAPLLRWREGERVTINVTNTLAEDTSIHWHGLILPSGQDGVPHISRGFSGIRPGETFTYQFDVVQNGTYWYHSHSGFQEQLGHYGAIVIEPNDPDPVSYDREHVIVLSDWTDRDPAGIFRTLKKNPEYFNFNQRTTDDLLDEIEAKGVSATWRDRAMWNRMRMTDRDISDVTGYTYTFLMNGATPAGGWTGLFKPGEKVRLRIINAAAMTIFDLRIPGLDMKVVASDGQNIEPVSVEEFRIGVAETYDVVVEPKADTAYCVFAQAIDRSGYARGTLTPDPALTVEPPPLDPRPVLTHGDMGMSMEGMDHSGHDMGGMDHAGHDMSSMDHSAHNMPATDHSGHNMSGTDHSSHASPVTRHPGHASPVTRHPQPGDAGMGSNAEIVHADSEYGPGIDMRAEEPIMRLDDPGVGLRNNGRRVLTYADLRHLGPSPDPREPSREIQLHLTGNMHRYMWSMDGIAFADAEPLEFRLGERLRVTLVNDTMMNHPIHLHGMWSDLETGDGERIPRKHTVIVQPGSKLSYLVTADAPGPWAYHCHLLYHMPGMFRKVVVS